MRARPKRSNNVISLADARKRREKEQDVREREEAMSFLPLIFREGTVARRGAFVDIVIDKAEGFGLMLTCRGALALAKALRSAALSKSRKRRRTHPRG